LAEIDTDHGSRQKGGHVRTLIVGLGMTDVRALTGGPMWGLTGAATGALGGRGR
jgi:hypothetical protein